MNDENINTIEDEKYENNPPPKVLGEGSFQLCFKSGLYVIIENAQMTRKVDFNNRYYEFRRNNEIVSTLIHDNSLDAIIKLP